MMRAGGNHKNIFTDAGVEWKEYSYFDKATVGLAFEGMLGDIKSAPEGSVIVLHGARHPPSTPILSGVLLLCCMASNVSQLNV